MIRWKIAGFCLLLFISCKPMMEKPKYPIIPKNDFIKVLIKIHLAEAISNSTSYRDSFSYFKAVNLPDSAIKQLGYTKAVFDSSVLYYSAYPKVYDEIYDKVIAELNRIDAELQKENRQLEKQKIKKK
jgi:hypothetical protein